MNVEQEMRSSSSQVFFFLVGLFADATDPLGVAGLDVEADACSSSTPRFYKQRQERTLCKKIPNTYLTLRPLAPLFFLLPRLLFRLRLPLNHRQQRITPPAQLCRTSRFKEPVKSEYRKLGYVAFDLFIHICISDASCCCCTVGGSGPWIRRRP